MSGKKTKLLRAAIACGKMAKPLVAGLVSSGKIAMPTTKQIRRAMRVTGYISPPKSEAKFTFPVALDSGAPR